MKAVVMAGGEGTRLRPLTCERPKPMVPVANRPLMEHIVALLRWHGVRELVATLQYLPEVIENYFGDGSDFGVAMSYSIEETPLGTAGSVKKIERCLDGTFLVISGDALTDVDLGDLVAFHRARKAVATIGLARSDRPLEFGVVITDEEGRITRFLEKPSWSEVFSDRINTGIYVLEPEVLELMEPGKPCDFSKDLFPRLLAAGRPLYGRLLRGYWCDVGSLEQYLEANYHALEGRVKVELPGRQLRDDIWVGEGCYLDPHAELEGPLLLGNNVQVRGGARLAEMTVVGDNTVIDGGVSIKRGVLWGNSFLGERAAVRGATVGRSCTIKRNCAIFEGAVVGDNCVLEEGSIVRPRVKIWPNKIIEAGTVVASSLVWATRHGRTLFGESGVTGLTNMEITPELATRLGAAFGTCFPRDTRIVISRDAHRSSRMIKHAFISGLLSAGINVLDLVSVPTPLNRYAIKMLGARGGVHVRISPFDRQAIDLKFFDSQGLEVDRHAERKIENTFFREDFRKVSPTAVGEISHPARTVERYTEDYLRALDAEAIRGRRFKVILDYSHGDAAAILSTILGRLGCEVIALNAYLDENRLSKTAEEFEADMNRLAVTTRSLQADIGVMMDCGAEKVFLVDERGNRLSPGLALAIMAFLLLKGAGGGAIAVPVNASRVIEEIAAELGGEVIRTRANPRALMEVASTGPVVFAGEDGGGYIFPRYQPYFDALMSFGKILELLAHEGMPLSLLSSRVPQPRVVRRSVDCPWELKGRVMRVLAEMASGERVELLDGIKIFRPDGWVLVLPDPAAPLYHVMGEFDGPGGEAVLEDYVRRIRELVQRRDAEGNFREERSWSG